MMTHRPSLKDFVLILGLGSTGLSCARFLHQKNINYRIMDTRKTPPKLTDYLKHFSANALKTGTLDERWLMNAREIIISPGLAKDHDILQKYKAKMISDIELFSRYNSKPVIAITGSNGKSTVTALLAHLASVAGVDVALGANFGTPALDLLLDKPDVAFYLLELSSFQLETTYKLESFAAVILNIEPDHLDRYETFESYADAKRRIYKDCSYPIINLDKPLTWKGLSLSNVITFSLDNEKADFYITKQNDNVYIATKKRLLMPISDLTIKGLHNVQNVLAALALGHAMTLPLEAMLTGLKSFSGLPHRCQWVRTLNQVEFYNDSKATNVASTGAALEGFGQIYQKKNIILIAGGQGKGADFSLLNEPVSRYVKALILIGEDAKKIHQGIKTNSVTVSYANSLKAAVFDSVKLSNPGDIVLLSPACASFDQFKNFEDRGNQFTEIILMLN